MNSRCPCRNISYSTWKLQTLRRLYKGAETVIGTPFLLLNPRSVNTTLLQTHSFHQSQSRTRYYIKDLKRTAKFKRVQLELAENTKSHQSFDTQSATTLITSSLVKNNANEWNPYDDASLQELQDLVGDLRLKARQAEEEEGVPFEHPLIYNRKKPNRPESPLERRQVWDRSMKLQVHEVEADPRLENNVWAQMLASPLRMDRGTRARLPRDLMLSWGIMRNPKDGEDYLLPIDFSDLNALQQELQQDEHTVTTERSSKAEHLDPRTPPQKTQPTMRIRIAGHKLLLQTMSDELTYVKRTKISGDEKKTLSGKLNANVVPHRWRLKQDELKAFHTTRANFNKTLNREPDEDEPNLDEMADFDNMQWQFDIAERIEKIMKQRVLMVLEAVALGNVSGRAIHDRRILAFSIPERGRLYLDEKGSLVGNRSTDIADGPEGNVTRNVKTPDYIHGCICIHIGSPQTYRDTIEQWHQQNYAKRQKGPSTLEELPSYDIMPPMITVNDQYRIPVFNLQSLLDNEHRDRLQQLLKDHKIFDLNFWQQRNGHPNGTNRETGFESDVHQTSARTTPTDYTPYSPLDAGEQVLSSIITPKLDARLPQPDEPFKSSPSPVIEDIDNPYLVLIKPRSKHGPLLIREIWQLWRYLGGRDGLFFDSSSRSDEPSKSTEMEQNQ